MTLLGEQDPSTKRQIANKYFAMDSPRPEQAKLTGSFPGCN
jgi:hypothetical protein